MPSPEFTVREDAGSRAFNNSALAMDQIMKAETEILESDELHRGAILDLPNHTERHRTPTAFAGMEELYPDLGSHVQPAPVWAALKAVVNIALSPWRGHSTSTHDAELDEALQRFSANLRVLPAKESNVISVSFTHLDPEMSAQVLNVMLARYAARRQVIYNDPQLAVAQHAVEDSAALVHRADLALTAFKARYGYSDYQTERDLLLRRHSQAEQMVADANAQVSQSQARLATLDIEIHRLPEKVSLYREDDNDARLQSVNEKLLDLSGQMAAARVHYRDNSRVIISLQSQISSQMTVKRLLAQEGGPSLSRTGRSQALDLLLVDRAHAMADRDGARIQSEVVQKQVDELAMQMRALNADESMFADLTRQKVAADESFVAANHAAAEQQLTEAEDARRLANVRIIQPARIPQHPTTLKLLICAAGLLLGGLFAVFWLVFKFTTETTFLTAAGLATATGLPVLGVFQLDQHAAGA
jgi:uncharacterized protein involved in exopolysaccharide biosynthesis